MNSPKRDWKDLTAQARQASAPADLDVRHAILQEIRAPQPTRVSAPAGLWTELFSLSRAGWLQSGLACLMALAGWACWQGLPVLNELSLLWSLEGPFLARF